MGAFRLSRYHFSQDVDQARVFPDFSQGKEPDHCATSEATQSAEVSLWCSKPTSDGFNLVHAPKEKEKQQSYDESNKNLTQPVQSGTFTTGPLRSWQVTASAQILPDMGLDTAGQSGSALEGPPGNSGLG